MSFKSKVLAAAATLTLIGGAGAAGVMTSGTAQAATPSCGGNCLDLFNHSFGPQFLLDVYKRGTAIGTPIILFPKNNEDPAEDFSIFEEGTVDQFFKAGLISAAFDLHYGADVALELEYTPYGVGTGECVGTATTAAQFDKISLQPCGVSSKTVWALDITDPQYIVSGSGQDVAFAAGSSTNFEFPQVLTYPTGGYPTDKPRPQVDTEQITGFFGQDGTGTPTGPAIDRQLWNALVGPIS